MRIKIHENEHKLVIADQSWFLDNVPVLLAGYRQPPVHHQLPGGPQSMSDLPSRPRPRRALHQEQVLLPELVQQQGGRDSRTIRYRLNNRPVFVKISK